MAEKEGEGNGRTKGTGDLKTNADVGEVRPPGPAEERLQTRLQDDPFRDIGGIDFEGETRKMHAVS